MALGWDGWHGGAGGPAHGMGVMLLHTTDVGIMMMPTNLGHSDLLVIANSK